MEHDPVNSQPQTGGKKTAASSQRRLDNLLDDIDFLFHEIRTPLTAVMNYAEFLKDQELTVDKQKPLFDIIQKEAQRIDDLLNDFSQSYQHNTGTWLAETSFSIINVEDLLREVIVRFRNSYSHHPIRVEVQPALPPIRGDWGKLYLVFRNLLANAIKYSPEEGEIFVSACEGNNEVIIKVRDQGVGISAECLQSIFKRGFRVKISGGKTLRGSGLGLAMVKRIVEGHNGKIHVESSQGIGSTFSISLPKFG